MTSRPALARLLLFLIGGWLFLSIAMSYTASANFAILKPATLRDSDAVYAAIPAGEARTQALRYAASEINRALFTTYNRVQLGLAVVCLFLNASIGTRSLLRRFLLLLCVGLAALFVFNLTPWMVSRGREIDFMPRTPEPAAVTDFKRMHSINVALEMVKMVALLVVAVAVIRDRRADATSAA
jgi:hypothetical protein